MSEILFLKCNMCPTGVWACVKNRHEVKFCKTCRRKQTCYLTYKGQKEMVGHACPSCRIRLYKGDAWDQ